MVVGKEVCLPEFSELTVPEVNVSSATLRAAGPYLGKACEAINNEFMLCRQENADPRPCLDLGKQVTECAMQVFQKIKTHCQCEFRQYATCVDKSSGNYEYRHCRKTQDVFDTCMRTNLCMERPDFGYFCRGRIHKSMTPAPPAPPCPCHPIVPDASPSLPDCKTRPPARFSSRFYWMTE